MEFFLHSLSLYLCIELAYICRFRQISVFIGECGLFRGSDDVFPCGLGIGGDVAEVELILVGWCHF